jgi:hypothetical protein
MEELTSAATSTATDDKDNTSGRIGRAASTENNEVASSTSTSNKSEGDTASPVGFRA